MKAVFTAIPLMLSLAISGCGGGASDSDYGGRSGSGKGHLTLAITDAAIDDITEVWIQFSAVELKPAGSSSFIETFDQPMKINLLALQGGLSEDLLTNITVASGEYNWIRVLVDVVADGTLDSYIVMKDGSMHELGIPSGSQTGLKINTNFTVGDNSKVNMTIDFDLRKSIVFASGEYHLKPVLRLVNNADSGSITGSIASDLTVGTSCSDSLPETGNAVYVFSGANAELDDIDNQLPEPITTALMTLNTSTGDYDYEVGFLPAGEYTVAYTCMADLDDPEADDLIDFVQTENVTVSSPELLGGAELNR